MRHARHTRGLDWLGRAGLVIVAVASVIQSLNDTSQSLVTKPLAVWAFNFLEALWVNAAVGLGMLLSAVWARDRHPKPGAPQLACAMLAVCVAALVAAIALEVHFFVGLVILLAAMWVRHDPGRARYASAFVAIVVAACLGALTYQVGPTPGTPYVGETRGFSGAMMDMAEDVARYAVVGMVVAGAWLYTRAEADHAAAIAQCAVDSARMDEQTAEARLQMLEAQIEPHFLFNTLAHVKRLYDTDRATGARMLRNLAAYLAVALPRMRANDPTLGRELDHATAYLDIQQIRMGRRLAYSIDVDDQLRGARLPPLMLLTVVENAIKHGLSPVPRGGRIDIRARLERDQLRIEVADTGGGFTKSGGKGAGLANIRARLSAQFGDKASLALAMNSPSGVVACITLPYMPAGPEAGTG